MKQAEIFFGWDWSLFCKFLWIYRPTIVHEHNFWQKWTAFINIKETISQLKNLILHWQCSSFFRLKILIFWISGSSETLYNSVHNKIFSLPPNYTLYPAHDYTGNVSYISAVNSNSDTFTLKSFLSFRLTYLGGYRMFFYGQIYEYVDDWTTQLITLLKIFEFRNNMFMCNFTKVF